MNAARLARSERLRRVYALLADGAQHSTLDIVRAAKVCAVSAIISELRQNGSRIKCTRKGDVWFYQMAVRKAA